MVLVMSKGRGVDILPVRSFTLDSYSHSLLSLLFLFSPFFIKEDNIVCLDEQKGEVVLAPVLVNLVPRDLHYL